MQKFKVRITRVSTEVFIYKTNAPDLEAAQVMAEHSEPDYSYRKQYQVVTRASVRELKPKNRRP